MSRKRKQDVAGQGEQERVTTPAPDATEKAGEVAGTADGTAAADDRPVADAVTEQQDVVAEMTRELETVTAELESLRDRWLRAVAEQENLRKRTQREVTDARRFAQADLMRDLLEVLDNFERAAASVEDQELPEQMRSFKEGMDLIRRHLWEVLAARGLERIEAGPGVRFDPSVHEAVMQTESAEHEQGAIVEVVQAGYRLGDLVVRPSRVVVAA